MTGIVQIVIDTPCYGCQRLVRYTAYHRADPAILARLRQHISHRDVHDIVAILESQHEQVPIGMCVCGAPGQETTSVEFRNHAKREDLNYVADDLSYENVSLSLDGETLWESDLEIWRKGLDDILQTPDPTPDEALAHSDQRMAELNAIQSRLHAAFMALDDDQPGAEYIRSKARLFCRIGADAYRKADAFRQPDRRLSPENLAAVSSAMHQFADGCGFSAANPLEIPVEFSHSAINAVHFQITSQMVRRSEDGRLTDALLGRHMIDGREVIVFNRVLRGQP